MPTINPISRRDFLISAGLTGVAFAANPSSTWNGFRANERACVGVIGLGSRGLRHVTAFTSLPNVEVSALCDINEPALKTVAAELTKSGRPQPAYFTDFRRLLDDRNIDVISIAAPRSIRARLAIQACDAGKHVMIERPCCDSISEGRNLEMVSKAKRRLVQQVTNEPLVLPAELLMFLKTRDAGEIARVSALQQVFVDSGRTNIERACLDDTLENLDLARCLMGVRFPDHVSSVESNGPTLRGISKSSFVFTNQDRWGRAIELAKFTSNSDARNLHEKHCNSLDAENRNGSLLQGDEVTSVSCLKFYTSQGEFAVSSGPSRHSGQELQSSCVNFISAVRDRNANALQNPIGEARVSSSLLKLAEASVKFNRGFAFDPDRECVVGDREIDAFVQ